MDFAYKLRVKKSATDEWVYFDGPEVLRTLEANIKVENSVVGRGESIHFTLSTNQYFFDSRANDIHINVLSKENIIYQ